MPRQNNRPKHPATGHRCPATGCQITVPNKYLMCGPHWRMVPLSLARRVYEELAAAQAGGWSPGRGLGPEALVVAQTEAIAAVNAKLAA